ncbi:hypothetical protein ACFU98_04865 [Streptomyces sp. NPDC057575]|uniref:hypothetical protein n=1 Tax=unclassified Streptomyces TaxID=2593676 RepID=UPI003690F593
MTHEDMSATHEDMPSPNGDAPNGGAPSRRRLLRAGLVLGPAVIAPMGAGPTSRS